MNIFYITLGILLLIVALVVGTKFYRKKYSHTTKKGATKVFKRSGTLKGFKTLSNVTLADGVIADQIMVGPFGVMIACDLHQTGKIYGDLESKEWILAVGEDGKEEKTRIDSPLAMARMCEKELRSKLAKAKIYSVPIEIMVVKTQNQACYITGTSGLVYDMKQLKELVNRVKYEKDNKVNVDTVITMLSD